MCKIVLLVSFKLLVLTAFSATKIWTGGNGNWNNASNWTPAGVPIAGDDVIFNTSVVVSIDISSPISINSLHFINNSSVLFETSSTRNFRLSSTSIVNPAFLIEAGSTFTLDGTNAGTNNSTIELYHGVGVIGQVYGTLNISCTGGANDGPSLDTYNSVTEYGVLTVYNGGAIKILPGADNTSSSMTPVPTIVMENGSLYENLKNGGSFPQGTWQPNSLAKASSPGTNTPQFVGNLYGNLEWNCTSQTSAPFFSDNVTFNNVNLVNTNIVHENGEFRIKSGPSLQSFTMTVNGNLTIGSNARLLITNNNVNVGHGGTLLVKGNIINQGTINTSGAPGTLNILSLNGTALQTITNSGVISGTEMDFIMDNVAGAQLLTSLTLPGNTPNSLQLVNGKIRTTSSSLLTMINDAGFTQSSTSSFIEGPMKKIGDESFAFPIGVGSIYAPIGFTNVSGQTVNDEFTAEYKRTNPESIHGSLVASGMNHISWVEYWSLVQNVGAATKNVSLAITFASFCYDIDQTYVSRWNGGHWSNEGAVVSFVGPTMGLLESGIITSVNSLSTYGDFTLITNLLPDENPLPIKLFSFDVTKLTDTKALISWELSANCSSAARFEVEKSIDGRNFNLLSIVAGSETSRLFNFVDTRLMHGRTFYRLKMIEPDGTFTYSKTIAIINDTKGLLITSLAPNPVKGQTMVTISAAKPAMVQFSVYDLMGKLVKQFSAKITEGTSVLPVELSSLPAGLYQLLAITGESKTVFRFSKQ